MSTQDQTIHASRSHLDASSSTPRLLLVGARGLIGSAIQQALASRQGSKLEVVTTHRVEPPQLDLEAHEAFDHALGQLGPLDHVIVAAGEATFAPYEGLDPESFALGIRSKLLGQVHLALAASRHLPRHGSITLTSGALARHPVAGSAPVAMVNGALESFVRAIALDLPEGPRINVVSPGWITETMRALGMDPAGGVPAREVAQLYLRAIDGSMHGAVLESAV